MKGARKGALSHHGGPAASLPAAQEPAGLQNSGSSMSSTSRTTPSSENWTHSTRFSPLAAYRYPHHWRA